MAINRKERKSLEDEYMHKSRTDNKRKQEGKEKQKGAGVAKKNTKKFAFDLKSKLKIGKVNIVNPANHRNDFYCSVCDVLKHDSSSYQSHITSKAHMKNIGKNLTVEKSSLTQIRNRLNGLTVPATTSSNKPPEIKKPQALKIQKKKVEENPLSKEQARMMELMGFTDFGPTTKP